MKNSSSERKTALENLREKVREIGRETIDTNFFIHISDAYEFVLKTIRIGLDFDEFHKVIEHLEKAKWQAAQSRHNSIFSIVNAEWLAWEIFADLPIPFVLADDAPVSPIGDISWKVDPCESHIKGGWTDFDENGKRKFIMPPHPAVDKICPKCGGYLPQERGAK